MKGYTGRKIELLYRFFHPKQTEKTSRPWNRILICNQGGLGDVYLSTFLIPALRNAFPGCEIGMLTTPETRGAVKDAEYLHSFPYWFDLKKSRVSRYFRFLNFLLFQKRQIAKELSKHNYDCAIVANPYFSGIGHALYRAKIPCRIGFETIGDRKFLTKMIPWDEGVYLLEHYKKLLSNIGAEAHIFHSPWEVKQVNNPTIVFHMFSADPKKDLPFSFWKELHGLFCSKGYEVYFTGKGETQRREIAKITCEAYNLCNKHDWKEFMEAICGATYLVSVDTAAVHIAAAAEKPFSVIYRHTPHFDLWYPASKKGRAMHWPVDPMEVFREVENESRC